MKLSVLLVIAAAMCVSVCVCLPYNRTLEHQIATGKYNATQSELLKIFQSYGFNPNPMNERFKLFKNRLLSIIMHNLNPHKTYTRGINRMTFMTRQELNLQSGSQNCSATAKYNVIKKNNTESSVSNLNVPDFVDWRLKGVVTPVKDQGNCGSCWTFSTTGAIESHWALHTGNAPPLLSEQQLVDCAGDFNNFGCHGGLPSQAYEYLAQAGGIETESDYPYEGQDGQCQFSKNQVAARVSGSYNITFQDETELIQHLATVGPISIAFEVLDDFVDYTSGIYSSPECSTSPDDVNHAVLAVGYSISGGYYIVKNSWSENWGEDGYFRIQLGTNMCGLADCASYPIINHTHHQSA